MDVTKLKEKGQELGTLDKFPRRVLPRTACCPKEAQDLGPTWLNPYISFQSQRLRERQGFAPSNTAKPGPGSRLLRHSESSWSRESGGLSRTA